jgi:hypothetical protein
LFTVSSAAPVGDPLSDFAFSMAAFRAAGVLRPTLGASPRWPIATGTRAIASLPAMIPVDVLGAKYKWARSAGLL